MIRLHLLGFTPDLKGLVFSGRRGGKQGTYWVPVDDDLQRAVEQLEEARDDADRKARTGPHEDPSDRPDPKPRPESLQPGPEEPERPAARAQSQLSPREIQGMLRQGRSVREVAQRAGVEEAWVERFLGPVLEEMTGIIQLTRDAYQSRARLGRSGTRIGESVLRNLEERKATAETLEQVSTGWEARRVGQRAWRVRLRFRHRGRQQTAEWEYRTDTKVVRPRNKQATDLGWRQPDDAPKVSSRASGGDDAGEETSTEQPSRRSKRPGSRRTGTRTAAGRKTKSAAGRKPKAGVRRTTARKPAAKRKPAATKRSSGGTGTRKSTKRAGRPAAKRPAKPARGQKTRKKGAGKPPSSPSKKKSSAKSRTARSASRRR